MMSKTSITNTVNEMCIFYFSQNWSYSVKILFEKIKMWDFLAPFLKMYKN